MKESMMVRIDPEIKKKLTQLARSEGKSSSQIIRDLIAEYVQDRDIGGYIDSLWSRISQKLRHKGLKSENIRQVIKEVRKNHS
jgi:predicted DNA-binding protein